MDDYPSMPSQKGPKYYPQHEGYQKTFTSKTPSYPKTDSINSKKQSSNKPLIAGILLIIASIIAILNYSYILFIFDDLSSIYSVIPNASDVSNILFVCFIIGIIFSILALLGGIISIKRKTWSLALTGSIFGLLTVGPLFISSVLSLVALILIAISKDDFL